MINKILVKKRFEKSFKTYDNNAFIQKYMAEKLINLLPVKTFDSIFEIGCATGILTKQILKNLIFKSFTANDLSEKSKIYIDKIIPQNNFILGDIENINLNETYDLIISNAVLQWCDNPEQVIKKLYSYLNKNGILAVSMFGKDNLKEIKTILNLPNSTILNIKAIEEIKTLYFDKPIDVLKHIKSTGANALTEYKFTKSSLNDFELKYKRLYSQNNKVILTYNPIYILLNKIM